MPLVNHLCRNSSYVYLCMFSNGLKNCFVAPSLLLGNSQSLRKNEPLSWCGIADSCMAPVFLLSGFGWALPACTVLCLAGSRAGGDCTTALVSTEPARWALSRGQLCPCWLWGLSVAEGLLEWDPYSNYSANLQPKWTFWSEIIW